MRAAKPAKIEAFVGRPKHLLPGTTSETFFCASSFITWLKKHKQAEKCVVQN